MSIEVWAGPECTVNRVGTKYFDQIVRSGHQERVDDLNLFAELGISKLRYPVLWERTAPNGVPDWRWSDQRLERLQDLGVAPIVGLLHHGSGPRFTSLIDPDFPDKFARYARDTAERYPWVEYYTPINEPLTTARFSGLYGHWYPHGHDDRIFARALIAQCTATALAMREIRKVNCGAKLVQTEDLGKVFAVPSLAHQAEFENERRWLTFDLLSGHVNEFHNMWSFLTESGISVRELNWLYENPCEPDVLGMNYYVTSDRFLDDRLERYPESVSGGNGRERYADVEAIRVDISDSLGFYSRLQEIWKRYRRPIALTEVHIGCAIDEQLRWLNEAWNAANEMRDAGADIRALTAWALLGSFDWNSLLTKNDGHYEPGVFHLRNSRPHPTDMVGLIRGLARGKQANHPALESAGWWRSADRIRFTHQDEPSDVFVTV